LLATGPGIDEQPLVQRFELLDIKGEVLVDVNTKGRRRRRSADEPRRRGLALYSMKRSCCSNRIGFFLSAA
jgi:hypothetical protein